MPHSYPFATGDPTRDALGAFYLDLLTELDRHMRRPGATVSGFGPVFKRVAQEHDVPSTSYPLPRLNRSEREHRGWDGGR